jgi:P-type Ca2+ transporter type 2C
LTFLPTELGFMQRILGLTSLNGNQWLICIGFAIALLLVDEVIKVFLRRRRSQAKAEK